MEWEGGCMENRQKGIFLTSFVLVMSSVNMLLYIYYKRGEVFTMSEKIILGEYCADTVN